MKAQFIIDKSTREIIRIDHCKGSVHDYKLFLDNKEYYDYDTHFLADSGYQGMENIYENSYTPYKKPPKMELTDFQKEVNKALSSERINVEHVIRSVKIFRIFSGVYRNRRRKFELRLNIIAAIHNLKLKAS